MRSSVCSGAAIMVWTFCSTMLMRSLKLASSWASRTRMEAFSLITWSRTWLLMRKPSPLWARSVRRLAFQTHERAALRADGLNGQIEDHGEEVASGRFSSRTRPASIKPEWRALWPARLMAVVWPMAWALAVNVVTTVEVLGEFDKSPSKTTTRSEESRPASGA